MDMLILGLLTLKSLTIYEIRVFLKESMYLMYSDSLGSIQSAIKKLFESGMITCNEYVESGKNKKTYTITEEGKESFLNWLSSPIKSDKLKNTEITKLFFLGMLPPEQRELQIKTYINNLKNKLKNFKNIKNKAQTVKYEQRLKDIAIFQLLTIQLAINEIDFEIMWYESLLKKLSMEEIYNEF